MEVPMFIKLVATALFAIVSIVFATATFAQEETKPAKIEGTATPLKYVSCAPSCGFRVQSHDEKEIIAMVKSHAKRAHHKILTDQQVKEMIKVVEN